MSYINHISTPRNKTPQTKKARSDQVRNNAGGFVFNVDCFTQLNRFLILGNEGGSYYASERSMTLKNVKCLDECVKTDGLRTVRTIVEVSDQGRAPKNDPAIFALAYCAKFGAKQESELQDQLTQLKAQLKDVDGRTAAARELRARITATGHEMQKLSAKYGPVRKAALEALPKVCRIGTHLFQFADTIDKLGGWGRGTTTAVADWYLNMAPQRLALQVVKYQQREGWSHRDLLRLSHVRGPKTGVRADILQYVAQPDSIEFDADCHEDLELIYATERAKRADSVGEVVGLIEEYRLPRECIPTQFLNDAKVWDAMLSAGMPLTAMIRNLGKMSSVGVLAPLSQGAKTVVNALSNGDALRKARVHPIQILSALLTYKSGRGIRGSLSWSAVPQVVSALDSAFYMAFDAVEPTGKNYLIGIDVSGSMSGGCIAGVPGLTPQMGATVLAMVAARTEPWCHVVGFDTNVKDLNINASDSLDQALRKTRPFNWGGTDCSKLFQHALRNRMDVDVFMTLTDNETWAGANGHPFQVLSEYRQRMRKPARSVVVGMLATPFTIADPRDAGSLDIAGFDTATPRLIAEFARGSF